jgi:hypothetical protein
LGRARIWFAWRNCAALMRNLETLDRQRSIISVSICSIIDRSPHLEIICTPNFCELSSKSNQPF